MKNYTDIVVVLDRSGSMRAIQNDTIGGYNTFLDKQKKAPGEATLSLYQFDDQYEPVYQAVDIQAVELLNSETFVPRGMTALLDAIGKTVASTGERLAKLEESERPTKVVFVIITDGGENSSKEYRADKVREMITHQQDKYAWEFVFLGANQDAFSVGTSYGIKGENTMTYAATGMGTMSAFCSFGSNLASVRSCAKADMSFTDEDKALQKAAGVQQ